MFSGRTACELAATGIGMALGAVGSGVSGGTLTGPAMIVGGTAGYLFGRVICKIPALERAFDKALSTKDWGILDQALADPQIQEQAVAALSAELGVDPANAETAWQALVQEVKKHPELLTRGESFKSARFMTPAGRNVDGLSRVRGAAGSTTSA
jgi:hypothetical protein